MHPALTLMGIYILVTALLQFGGYMFAPTISLTVFIVIFLLMFGLGWPIAVRITAWLIPEADAERQARIGNVSVTRLLRKS
jgi:hypothetical protein